MLIAGILRIFGIGIPILAISIAGWFSVYAQERVSLKAFEGETFSRLVFEWPEPVQYDAKVGNRKLIVSFGRPFGGDLDVLPNLLPSLIESSLLESGGRKVTINFRQTLSVQTTVSGSSIVFEFRSIAQDFSTESNDDTLAKSSASTNEQNLELVGSVRVRAGKHKNYTRVVFDWPRNVGYVAEESAEKITIDFDRSAKFDFPASLLSGKFPFVSGLSQQSGDTKSSVVIDVLQGTTLRHFRNKTSVVVDVFNSDSPDRAATQSTASLSEGKTRRSGNEVARVVSSNEKGKDDPKLKDLPEKNGTKQPTKKKGKGPLSEFTAERPGRLKVNILSKEVGLTALFVWEAPTSAAVFERAGFHWVVFGGQGPMELGPIDPSVSEDLLLMEPVKIMRGTAVRMRVRDGLFAHVARRGPAWKVDFQPEPLPLTRPLLARRQPDWPTGPEGTYSYGRCI